MEKHLVVLRGRFYEQIQINVGWRELSLEYCTSVLVCTSRSLRLPYNTSTETAAVQTD